jgi:hypothetical protein
MEAGVVHVTHGPSFPLNFETSQLHRYGSTESLLCIFSNNLSPSSASNS